MCQATRSRLCSWLICLSLPHNAFVAIFFRSCLTILMNVRLTKQSGSVTQKRSADEVKVLGSKQVAFVICVGPRAMLGYYSNKSLHLYT